MGSYKTAVCGGAYCKCMEGRSGGCINWHTGDHICPDLPSVVANTESWETIRNALGDICHEQYFGSYWDKENNRYEYLYGNEVINLLDDERAEKLFTTAIQAAKIEALEQLKADIGTTPNGDELWRYGGEARGEINERNETLIKIDTELSKLRSK